ncbi:MAG: hypothetical protein ACRDY1_11435, partial [Acidimicrobiales bacterium]
GWDGPVAPDQRGCGETGDENFWLPDDADASGFGQAAAAPDAQRGEVTGAPVLYTAWGAEPLVTDGLAWSDRSVVTDEPGWVDEPATGELEWAETGDPGGY